MTYPIFYEHRHCFYMITDVRQYTRVTLYERCGQFGITNEVVLTPEYIMQKGAKINQHEFFIAYAKAQAKLNENMKEYLPAPAPVIDIPY